MYRISDVFDVFSNESSQDWEDNVRNVLHTDPNDKSHTLLLLYQDMDTPPRHRAYWKDYSCDAPTVLTGGLCLIFDGHGVHGLMPPLESSKEWPYFGMTILRKQHCELEWLYISINNSNCYRSQKLKVFVESGDADVAFD
jgi:hypothetical protein